VDFRADPSRPTMARARDEGVGEVGEAGAVFVLESADGDR